MSAIAKPVGALKGLGIRPTVGLDYGTQFLVVDPGKRCGWVWVGATEDGGYRICKPDTCSLDELPDLLISMLRGSHAFVVCEDYTLRGGTARNDPKMPSAQGIGMCRAICEYAGCLMYLIQPNQKAPMAWFRYADSKARDLCRNDHERDAVDLAVYVLRQLEQGT